VTFPFKGVIEKDSSFVAGNEAVSASLPLRNSKYLYLLCALFFLRCILQPTSSIPGDEAKIIREILRENGYSVGNNENVDKYLGFRSSNPEVDLEDQYYLLLPAKNERTLKLSDKLNYLDPKSFLGVNTISTVSEDSRIDSIAIISDSIIKIFDLDAENNNIKVIPKEISRLRSTRVMLGGNQISILPSEIMQIFDTNYYHAAAGEIYLDWNRIDTLLLSDTLKAWLSKYAYGGADWWRLQENYLVPQKNP
jgi:hypothetical protein